MTKDTPKEMELVQQPRAPAALVNLDNPVSTVTAMLQTVLQQGVTEQNVAALDKLVGLFERMQAKSAEQQFNQAFTALQQEMPAVQATKAVPNSDGTTRYKFAPYPEVMKQVQPILTRHGFSVRFSSKVGDGRITMFCTLMHIGGHSVTNEFTVRIGKGPPGASESQADGSAASYAQRGALCDALNIVVRHDDDARIEGAAITPEQAKSLKERVKKTGSDEKAFLKYGQSPISDNATEADVMAAYSKIPSSMYALLDASLKRKEKT